MTSYATTDMMSSIIGFVAAVRDALRAECGINVAEYRMLAFLCDQEKGSRPLTMAQTLDVSPAMITLTADSLVEKGLAERVHAHGEALLAATDRGALLSRDADLVLERIHASCFSPLAPEQERIIVVGTQMTVMAVTKTHRMRDDDYFWEYGTFHAFLIIERMMTETAQFCGLSMNGFRILFHLCECGGSATPGELGERLILAPSAITYATKGLERDGLVERAAYKLDKRRVSVRLTDRGAAVFRDALGRMDPLLTSGFRDAPASERKTIQRASRLIASALREMSGT